MERNKFNIENYIISSKNELLFRLLGHDIFSMLKVNYKVTPQIMRNSSVFN